MKKAMFLFLCSGVMLNVQGQVKIKKSVIEGKWVCSSVSYGEYYEYDVSTNELKPRPSLKKLIAEDPERLGEQFLTTLKNKLSSQLKLSGISFNSNDTYNLILNDTNEEGTYEILKPFVLDPKSETPESDMADYESYGNGKNTRIELANKKRYDKLTIHYYVDEKVLTISASPDGASSDAVFVLYYFKKLNSN
jgi:hypothetical protein